VSHDNVLCIDESLIAITNPVKTKTFQGDRFIAKRDSNRQELQYENEECMLYQTIKKKAKNSDDNSSKGSPNEEKNKQMYQNLLAEQVLGEDVFSITPDYENLTYPLMKTNDLLSVPRQSVLCPKDTYYDQHSSIACNFQGESSSRNF
jgi:hypothetical protein